MNHIEELAEDLAGSMRRARQLAAEELADMAKENPAAVIPVVPALVDALNRPEASTRANCLAALTACTPLAAAACEEGIAGAGEAMFDEESALVRLRATEFLCALGSLNPEESLKVWGLIDEGIQCFHGDAGFQEMLTAIVAFSAADIAPEVKAALKDRMAYDAENARGALQRKAAQIMANVK